MEMTQTSLITYYHAKCLSSVAFITNTQKFEETQTHILVHLALLYRCRGHNNDLNYVISPKKQPCSSIIGQYFYNKTVSCLQFVSQ